MLLDLAVTNNTLLTWALVLFIVCAVVWLITYLLGHVHRP